MKELPNLHPKVNNYLKYCGIPTGIPESNIIHLIHRFRRFSQIIDTNFFIRENS